jgi:hypothetical protein
MGGSEIAEEYDVGTATFWDIKISEEWFLNFFLPFLQ